MNKKTASTIMLAGAMSAAPLLAALTWTGAGDHISLFKEQRVTATTTYTLTARSESVEPKAAQTAQTTVTVIVPTASTDTDMDGLPDLDEVSKYSTNPNHHDSDGDGTSDGMEIASGLNPNNPSEFLKKPNIIYILADDLGYGDLGCYGQKVIQTPHLDKLADEGMRFTRHYAGSTVCGPSRSCLLEGKHSGHTYTRGNGKIQMREDPHEIIFPSALKQAGYHTAMIGKSGLGCNTDDAELPFKKGFGYFFGFTSHTAAHSYFPEYLWRNDGGKVSKIEYPNNTLHEGDNYSSELVIAEALDYIERQKDGPFFLHLAFQIPHASLRAKEEWKAKYRPILKEEPLPIKEHKHYSYEREPMTTYAAMVSYLDHNMGLLLSKLRELKLADKTPIMFASDNGAMQEGGHNRESFDSNGILRGGKRDMWEGGVRTPMIAWWPGKINAGSVTNHVSAFWDISPTLREIAGAEPQLDTDGISMVPTLLGKAGQKKHDYLYWEFYESKGKRSILKNDWKLIFYNTNRDLEPQMELFNLAADPSEDNNLADQYPERVAELRALMDEAHLEAEVDKFKIAAERNAKKQKKK